MFFSSKVNKKNLVIKKPKTSRSAFFQKAQHDVLGFFKMSHFLIAFEEKKGIICQHSQIYHMDDL